MSHVSACSSALGLELELVYKRSSQQDPEVERKPSFLGFNIIHETVYKTLSFLGQSHACGRSAYSHLQPAESGQQLSPFPQPGIYKPHMLHSCILVPSNRLAGHLALKSLWLPTNWFWLFIR